MRVKKELYDRNICVKFQYIRNTNSRWGILKRQTGTKWQLEEDQM